MKIIESNLIAGSVTYAFAEVDKKVADLKSQGVKVIDFGVGDPQDPTPEFIIQALYEGAHRHASSGYPSYIGDLDFRKTAAQYMKNTYGVTLDPETEISSTIGSKEAVFHFPKAFANPGDIVICPTPGYPPYKMGTKFAGAIPYLVPLAEDNNFLIDFEAIPEDIARKAKIIWTCYPNSPTGKLAPRQWLEKLVDWAQKYEIIIAADEGCYHEIYFDEKPLSILEVAKDGIVVFYSLSKSSNMTGYRVGFVAGDERIISAFRKVKTQMDSGTPSFVQDAASAALLDTNFVTENRMKYAQKRSIMLNALEKAGLPECQSESTFYLWQKAPNGITGEDLANKLLEIGIVVTPGGWISEATVNGTNPGKNYVRFALVPKMEEVEEAGERLEDLRI